MSPLLSSSKVSAQASGVASQLSWNWGVPLGNKRIWLPLHDILAGGYLCPVSKGLDSPSRACYPSSQRSSQIHVCPVSRSPAAGFVLDRLGQDS